jgi:hypothetical protein
MKLSLKSGALQAVCAAWGVALLALGSPAAAAPQLLGSNITIDAGEWRDARCAHSGTSGNYLVVWIDKATSTATQGDLVAQRYNSSTGALIGSKLVLDGTGRASEPVVGWCRQANRYLVVWSQMDLGTQRDLLGRTVDASSGALGNGGALLFTTGISEQPIAISNEVSTADDELLLIYSASSAPKTALLRQVNVPTSGFPAFVGSATTITTALDLGISGLEPVVISSQGGSVGRFAVAYRKELPLGGEQLYARAFDRNATALGQEVSLPYGSYNLSIDGDGASFLVVAQTAGFQYDPVFGMALEYLPANGQLVLRGYDEYTASTYIDGYSTLNVAMTGEGAMLAFSDSDFGGNPSIYCYALDGLTGEQLAGSIAGGNGLLVPGGLTGLYRGQTPEEVIDSNLKDDFFFLLTELNGDLVARRYAQAGRSVNLGGGCGSVGQSLAAGMFVGEGVSPISSLGADLHLSLEGDAPIWPVFALIGLEGIPVACGPCTLRVDLSSMAMLPRTTTSTGEAEVAVEIPNVSSLIGLSVISQWVMQSIIPQCTTLQAHFSDAIRVAIG